MVGQNDKHQITVVFCGSLQGDFLHVQVIYKGKTTRCQYFEFPLSWHVTHSPHLWLTETAMFQYIENIKEPYVSLLQDVLHGHNTWSNYHGQF